MIRNMTTFQKKIIPGAGNSRVVLGKAPSDFFVLFFNCETLPLPGAILVFNQDFYTENDGRGGRSAESQFRQHQGIILGQ